MKIHAIYDKSGRIIAGNIPSPGPFAEFNPLAIGAAHHGPGPRPMITEGSDYLEGVFEVPDELTLLTPADLTRTMEHVTVDLKEKKLKVAKVIRTSL